MEATAGSGNAVLMHEAGLPDENEQRHDIERHSVASHVTLIDPKTAQPQSTPAPLDWAGPDDPSNPLNWSLAERVWNMIVLALLLLAVLVGASIYVAAVPEISEKFHVSTTAAITPFTTFVLGLSFGPIISAPLSEKHGRRFVYLTCLPLYALFVMAIGLSKNFGSIVVLRFFAGMFGSPPVAVAAGSGADFSTPLNRGSVFSVIAVTSLIGPAIGPLIGAFVVNRKGWQWTQWVTLMFIGVAFLSTLSTKETYKKAILTKRAKKRGQEVPAGPTGMAALKFLIKVTLIRPVHMLYAEPIVIFLSIYTAFFFGTIYSFFVAFPYVFETVYGFTPEQQGLTFISIVVGSILGSLINLVCDVLIYQPRFKQRQMNPAVKLEPELRLYPAIIAGTLAPIGLFWFAWTTTAGIHWICPLIAAVLVGAANAGIFLSIILYLTDTYAALLSASAMAANGILRYALGGAFPLFTLQMYQRLGVHWASTLLAFISLVLLPIPMVIFVFGRDIRLRSKYISPPS